MVERVDWPIEISLNLTDEMNNSNFPEINHPSLRLIEQNLTGGLPLQVMTLQFDNGTGFNASTNFAGTLSFIMNGTTAGNESRLFCLYYDTSSKPQKSEAEIPYDWSGEELNVNVSIYDGGQWKGLRYFIDTKRGENASGLYKLNDFGGNNFWTVPSESENPVEYIKYSNDTLNFSFDLMNDMTIVYKGPVRIVAEQKGKEVIWNSTNNQTEGEITKTYIFYNQSQWIKVNQSFRNTADYNITRKSHYAEALSLDIVNMEYNYVILGDGSEPGSWYWFAYDSANFHVGVINVQHSGNYTAVDRTTDNGKGGIELNLTLVQPNQTIWDLTVLHFNSPQNIKSTPAHTQVEAVRNSLMNLENITEFLSEKWTVILNATTNHSYYNKGENVTILSNTTYDSGLVEKVNATISHSEGTTYFDLYDDGEHNDLGANDSVYGNWFVINETNITGVWNFTSYAWDKENLLLNTSLRQFNVTNVYTLNLSVLNDYGFTNRTVNSTIELMNYRMDEYIPGANITCNVGGGNIEVNTTDLANGTYLISITAPELYGEYTLNCSGSKLNNTGTGTDGFTAVEYTTEVVGELNVTSPGFTLQNINLTYGENFTLVATAINLGNGTGIGINFTLVLLPGWYSNYTFEQVGDLNLTHNKSFIYEVATPANLTPGLYPVNGTVTWMNSDSSSDSYNFTFNVTVDPNPILGINEPGFYAPVDPGGWTLIDNITVLSLGNIAIHNITFNVSGSDFENMTFNFTPPNITQLFQGEFVLVEFWVYMDSEHPRGTFFGTLNATSEDGGYVEVPVEIGLLETFLDVNVTPLYFLSDQMRWFTFQNFTFSVNVSNPGSSTAFSTNVTIKMPESAWKTNVTNDTYFCGDLGPDDFCFVEFNTGVMQSVANNYTVNVNVSWFNPGMGVYYNNTPVQVEVLQHPEFNITEENITGNATHDMETLLGSFTLRNTGNVQISGVTMPFYNLSAFSPEVDPVYVSFINGFIGTFYVNVTIPAGYDPGIYLGILNVTTSNAGNDTVLINMTVPYSRTWTLNPTNCTFAVSQDTGLLCTAFVNNTGNTQMNFSINPSLDNYTYPNTTFFTVNKQTGSYVQFLWNLTGVARDFYNATFNISSNFSSPAYQLLKTYMIPSEKAEINFSLSSNVTMENQNITLTFNITDKSGQGIQSTSVYVYLPNGTFQNTTVSSMYQQNNTYFYSTNYPGTWGNSSVMGNYTLQIATRDNLGIFSDANTTFYVYPRIGVTMETGFNTYFSGETASIFVNLTDISKVPILCSGNISVYDPQGYLRYQENFSGTGPLVPITQFTIPSDSPSGTYVIRVNVTHFDQNVSVTSYGNFTRTFQVAEPYELEFETSLIWYPNSLMNFYVLAYTQKQYTTPDRITLTVLDPSQQLYFQSSSFTTVNSTSTGMIYLHNHAMAPNSPVGYYLASVILEKGDRSVRSLKTFRVSYGGPYDVVITSIEAEVPQATNQDFSILVENMGDYGQDIFLSYWISDSSNHTFSSVSNEAVFVDAGGNRTLSRALAVYSSQAAGDYLLHVRVNYSTENPPIETYRTFRVIKPSEEEPSIIIPVQAAVIELTITNIFPEELIVNRGSIGYVTIEVKNTGNVPLTEISAFFSDVDTDWFDVARGVSSLAPGASGYLIVKFNIPTDADGRTYVSRMKIIAKEVEVSEFYKIIVFKTSRDALYAKVNSLRSTLLDLEDETGMLAARGKDVTTILSLLRKSREFLDIAEMYLEEDKTVEAINAISEVEGVMEEIKYKLEISQPSLIPIPQIPEIPANWYVIGISLAAFLVLLFIAFKKFMKYKKGETDKSFMKLKNAMSLSGKTKETSSGVYETIKSQYEEGMISRETFEELKNLMK